MDDAAIRAAIGDALKAVAPNADIAGLNEAAAVREQIEIDSVDYLNFILHLEKALNVKVPEIDYPKLASIRGARDYLAELLVKAK